MIKNQKGLTLIELSIVLIVIGFLVSSFIELYQIQLRKKLEEQQEYKVFTIGDAIARYRTQNGHYPCPGRLNFGVSDANFAQITEYVADHDGIPSTPDEMSCSDMSASPVVTPDNFDVTEGYGVVAGMSGARVRYGAVPYKELGIGKEDVIDAYGNQFTYAVVETQAARTLSTPDECTNTPTPAYCQISLLDVDLTACDPATGICQTATDNTRPVDMVFFSHGKNGAGSFTASGVANAQLCNASLVTGDRENCDTDAIFVTEQYTARSSSFVGQPSDDKLTYEALNWVYIWDEITGSPETIYNRATGNMAVGLTKVDTALEKLHVANGHLRVEDDGNINTSGKIQTTQICDEVSGSGNCFEPEVIAGLEANPKRLQCGDGMVMSGVANSVAQCRSVLLMNNITPSTGVCGPALYVAGISVDPSTGSVTLDCQPEP